jgi:two-component system nitrogen regulation sensor histidine kinase GlnL
MPCRNGVVFVARISSTVLSTICGGAEEVRPALAAERRIPVQAPGASARRQRGAPAARPPSAAAPLEAARLLLDAPHEELRQRIGQLITLYQIGRAISESRNWSEALDYFLATLRDYLGVQGGAILLWSREATVLTPRTVLAMPETDVERCRAALRRAFPVGSPMAEIHPLECWEGGAPRCVGHAGAWRLTVLPLLYRRTPLGFLVLDKPYTGGDEFAAELFFLQTIQTILGEEVANAVHLSRLVDLKNFNEAVLDNVESGVVTVSERGTVTFANRLARSILGLEPQAPLPAHWEFDTAFRIAGEPALARLRRDAARAGGWTGEVRRTDGRNVPVRLRVRRILDPGDSEPLLVVAFEDLSVQRTLEEQARRADRLRSLGELSAAIAHEVRNPLQGISLTLSNLQEHLRPGAEHYVQVIFAEMARLDGIVGGILDLARPSPPMLGDVALAAVAARARDLVSEHAKRRGVRVEAPPAALDDGCEADERQLLQVVLNLARNAVDASPAGGRVTLRVEAASERPDDSPGIALSVHDEGPGIAPELRDKLFLPFFTTKSDGTGLGLAVCQKIVEEHHGALHWSSEPGRGTTFTVELPRRQSGAAHAAPRGTEEDSSSCA